MQVRARQTQGDRGKARQAVKLIIAAQHRFRGDAHHHAGRKRGADVISDMLERGNVVKRNEQHHQIACASQGVVQLLGHFHARGSGVEVSADG